MLKSEALEFLSGWPSYKDKIFKVPGMLAPDEYAVYGKSFDDSQYFFMAALSTAKNLKNLSKDDFVLHLVNQWLVYADDYMPSNGRTALSLKTKGCECGVYSVSGNTPEMHSDYCPLYKKRTNNDNEEQNPSY